MHRNTNAKNLRHWLDVHIADGELQEDRLGSPELGGNLGSSVPEAGKEKRRCFERFHIPVWRALHRRIRQPVLSPFHVLSSANGSRRELPGTEG